MASHTDPIKKAVMGYILKAKTLPTHSEMSVALNLSLPQVRYAVAALKNELAIRTSGSGRSTTMTIVDSGKVLWYARIRDSRMAAAARKDDGRMDDRGRRERDMNRTKRWLALCTKKDVWYGPRLLSAAVVPAVTGM